jgi:hypothetical protein
MEIQMTPFVLITVLIVHIGIALLMAFRPNKVPEPVTPVKFENRIISDYITYTGDNRVAVAECFANPHFPENQEDGSVRITVTQTYPLAEYWVVDEAAAFFQDEGKLRRCLTEGPFPWYRDRREDGILTHSWTMHRLRHRHYALNFYLRREKEGMTHKELVKSLSPHEDNFTVEIVAIHCPEQN